MAYSEDLKRRVLSYLAAGGSKVEAVKVFSVARPPSTSGWASQPITKDANLAPRLVWATRSTV
jgi:hypothetical protein